MSISSSDSNKNLHSFEFVLKKLHQIINALGEFKNHYDKKLNFGKLIKYLKIPNTEVDNLIYLILSFQERFDGVFGECGLKKKVMNFWVKFLITMFLSGEKRIFISGNYEAHPD